MLRFMILSIGFSLSRYHQPVKKFALHLNKLESPSTKEAFMQSLVKIGPVILKKIFEICPYIFVVLL